MTELQQILARLERIEALLEQGSPRATGTGTIAGMDEHQYRAACRNPTIFKALAKERARQQRKKKQVAA